MRNAIRAVLGLMMAVLAVLGSLGPNDDPRPAEVEVSSGSSH
ncbi:hypothetical protein SAMN05216276_102748 [Streptosporangium subroseum]|uniref:Uncharacterized protein n=1 Tax=Streptosporangium subroseum TaxID=106412 RepID=A0A239KK24_9ACTN|nr:hypothetical protein SAMN05216276_102748 [Streptosporangium subroseum]